MKRSVTQGLVRGDAVPDFASLYPGYLLTTIRFAATVSEI
jgi:hypothetical protein